MLHTPPARGGDVGAIDERSQSSHRLKTRMKQSPVKKVGSENPMKASVVVSWSKTEYGRSAEYVPIGSATSRPRICALPRTKSESQALEDQRVHVTRLTNEKPQSPCSIAPSSARSARPADRRGRTWRADSVGLRRDVGVGGQLLERVAGRQGEDGERTRLMPKMTGTATSSDG